MTERLLQKAKRGNADAFIALCAPFEAMIYRHCLQMLHNPTDAQDSAQETMLRAYRSFARFEGRSELGTWLFRIAHNTCLDAIKKVYRDKEKTSLDALKEQGYDPPSTSVDPETAYVASSEQEAIAQAISTLSDRQQTMLSLRYGDGMSYEQIAEVMNIHLGTVKSALNRAKDSLRTAVTTQNET